MGLGKREKREARLDQALVNLKALPKDEVFPLVVEQGWESGVDKIMQAPKIKTITLTEPARKALAQVKMADFYPWLASSAQSTTANQQTHEVTTQDHHGPLVHVCGETFVQTFTDWEKAH